MSNNKILILSIYLVSFALLTLTGCNKVQISAEEVPTDSEAFAQSTPPPNTPIVEQACQNIVNHSNQSFSYVFPKPSITCEWNKNGNLSQRNEYFQARIEQEQKLNLPPNAIICDVKFKFQQQQYLYDDHFLVTFNNAIIASSYNFQSRLDRVYGLLRYDWSKIAGMYWDQSAEGVYCAANGTCMWPDTDKQGIISLNYPATLFQRLMAEDLNRNEHSLKFISIGDNDDKDCEHSAVNFTLDVDYVVPQ